MPLTVKKIASIRRPGKYPDGGNLYLQVNPNGAKSWLFRYMKDGRDRAMGLGPVDLVSLAEARQKAIDLRRQLLVGIDPLAASQSKRAAARIAAQNCWTFSRACTDYIATKAAGWKHPAVEREWRNSVKNHCGLIAEADVAAIGVDEIVAVLTPIWTTKPVAARRLLQRLDIVFRFAKAKGKLTAPSPADPEVLGHLLPEQRHQVESFAAVPVDELPAVMAKLRADPRPAARAAEFCILTASRPAMVTGAESTEIDLATKTWTVPSARMKKGREHRVPLSRRALAILAELPRAGAFVFGGDAPLGDRALDAPLKAIVPATVHGTSRSTFQDFSEDRAGYPPELTEAALAHLPKGRTRQAYRRGDLLDRRRPMMATWDRFCAGEPAHSGEVVELPVREAAA